MQTMTPPDHVPEDLPAANGAGRASPSPEDRQAITLDLIHAAAARAQAAHVRSREAFQEAHRLIERSADLARAEGERAREDRTARSAAEGRAERAEAEVRALTARLREAERRLRQVQVSGGAPSPVPSAPTSSRARPPLPPRAPASATSTPRRKIWGWR